MPTTRSSSRKKKKSSDDEREEAKDSALQDNDRSSSMSPKHQSSKQSSRQVIRQERHKLKSRTTGVGIAISTNATNHNKIVFDANEKEQQFHDDNISDINPDNVKEDSDSDDDDDDR